MRVDGRSAGLPCWSLALLAAVSLLSGAARAGDKELLVLEHSGIEYGYTDPDNPEHGILVIVEGVVLRRGELRLLADTLVLVWRKSGGEDAAAFSQMFDNDRIIDVFLDGRVTVEERGVTIATAESLLLDNPSGKITLLDGSWRTTLRDQTLVVRFQLLRQLADETREIEGLTYTTCDYEHAHWGIDSPWAVLVPTDEGRVLMTAPNFGWLGPVTLAPAPGFHFNLDRDRPPLRSLTFGTSSEYGTEVESTWQGDASATMTQLGQEFFGADGPVDGQWLMELDNYSSRGLFIQPAWSWKTERSRGRLLLASINDRNKRDSLGQNIEDDTRGRILLQHRTELDDKRTIDVEFNRFSDRGFQREYYVGEFQQGKAPESYVSYRDADGDEVDSVLVRGQANNYETRREYLPQVERRIVGREVDLGVLGSGFVSGRDFADYARLRVADEAEPYIDINGTPVVPAPSPIEDTAVARVGVRRQLDVPFDVGDDRIVATAAVDLTAFDHQIEGDPDVPASLVETDDSAGRYALLGGVRWARTYSGVGEFQSDTWNFDGVRQIVEPSLGYFNVFELNRRPSGLVAIDEVERLDKLQFFQAGIRHRIQTHRDGKVVTVLNTEVTLPFYPNEQRDNPVLHYDPGASGSDPNANPSNLRRTIGDLRFDMIWKPDADIWGLQRSTIAWRGEADPNNGWAYTKSTLTYRFEYDEEKSIFVTQTKSRPRNRAPAPIDGRSAGTNTVTLGGEWVLSPRWRGAAFVRKDLRLGETERVGLIVRQIAHKWLLDMELSRRRAASVDSTLERKDTTRFSLSLSPLIFNDPQKSLIDEIGRIRKR